MEYCVPVDHSQSVVAKQGPFKSIVSSGGTKTGIETSSKLGSPISFLASHRNGFSKL
jgi:hypothetical protein